LTFRTGALRPKGRGLRIPTEHLGWPILAYDLRDPTGARHRVETLAHLDLNAPPTAPRDCAAVATKPGRVKADDKRAARFVIRLACAGNQ
jgi:hypothetical protein